MINLKDYKDGEKSNKIDDSSVALGTKDIEKGDSIKVHPTPPEKTEILNNLLK